VTELAEGCGLVLDRSVRTFRNGTVLVGGHPGRLMTLTRQGAETLAALVAGGNGDKAARRLAGRLIEAGMANPQWPAVEPGVVGGGGRGAAVLAGVTVVVPARDRTGALDRCLAALDGAVPVVVVDDGSSDPESVAATCRRHRATLMVRPTNGGPAVARNQALAAISSPLVAFVDSDCSVTPDALARLVAVLDDPTVGAVAPRIRPAAPGHPGTARAGADRGWLGAFSAHRSALDLGADAGEVGPDRRVRYVPSAALVARRTAVTDGFDPALRVGEDVDLVWRLVAAGWRVRYEPSVVVHHEEPSTWTALLTRRFRYGTSAGPLAARHPGRLAPVELRPLPTAAVAAALARRPTLVAAAVLTSAVELARTFVPRGVPPAQCLRWSAGGVGWTLIGMGRAVTMLAGPAMLVLALVRPRSRAAVAALALAPPVVEWWQRRPPLDPVRWAVASVAEDVAYGAGVWAGCVAARSFAPLLPAVRMSRAGGAEATGETDR
jgi:mycofactocin system glycosyltransferase